MRENRCYRLKSSKQENDAKLNDAVVIVIVVSRSLSSLCHQHHMYFDILRSVRFIRFVRSMSCITQELSKLKEFVARFENKKSELSK